MVNLGDEEPLKPETILLLKKNLGNNVVTQEMREDRKITSIDWEATNASAEVIELVCDKFMHLEGVDYKEDAGHVGLVTEDGPLLRALVDEKSPDFGRLVILDESNRLPEGDALLTIQAFFSEPGAGELKLEGGDDKVFTIKRDKIPSTFLFLGTSNQAVEENGDSARKLSRPEISRQGQGIDIRLISEPTKEDYFSRTLKHLTGVPAYYTYMSDRDYWDKNPSELAEELKRQRTIGLTKEEIKEIPQEEMFNIKHIGRTVKVARQVAELLYNTDKLILATSKDGSLPEGYTSYLRDEAVVDLRYIFKLIQHSKIEQAKSTKGGAAMFKKIKNTQPKSEEDVLFAMERRLKTRDRAHMLHRGVKLENELSQKLYNMLIPEDIDKKLRDSISPEDDFKKIEAIWGGLRQKAKGLKFQFAGYEGQDSVTNLYNAKEEDFPVAATEGLRNMLLGAMNEVYNTKFKAEDVLDEESLGEALKMLGENGKERNFVIPNLDKRKSSFEPLKAVYLAQGKQNDGIEREELLTVNEFANSFILKQMRSRNMKRIANEKVNIPDGVDVNNEALKIANGEHEIFQTTTVMLNDEAQEKIGMAHIIYNKSTDYAFVLSDFDVSPRVRTALSENGAFFVNCEHLEEEFKVISSELRKQLGGVQEDAIANAIMLRIDLDLATVSEVYGELDNFFQFVTQEDGMCPPEKVDAVMLTSKEFSQNIPIRDILKNKGR